MGFIGPFCFLSLEVDGGVHSCFLATPPCGLISHPELSDTEELFEVYRAREYFRREFFFLSLLHFHVVKQILILSGHASFSRNETDLIVKKILVDMIVKFSRFPSHKICGTHVLRAADSALCL